MITHTHTKEMMKFSRYLLSAVAKQIFDDEEHKKVSYWLQNKEKKLFHFRLYLKEGAANFN